MPLLGGRMPRKDDFMNSFPISLASYSFHGALEKKQIDIFSYLHLLKYKYAVTYADIWTGILTNQEEDCIKAIRETMDRYDISLANLCVDGPHLWVDDPEERAQHKEQMLRYIGIANTLGAKTIRIDFGGSEDKPMTEEALEYLANTYREYCGICYDLGMKIGPENHWGWDKSVENLRKVKEAVDHPAYGHLFHLTGFREGEVEEGTELAVSYAMHTHIPANSIPEAKKLIRKLYESGYQGTYSVEHHSGEHELQRVEWQLGAVRSLVEEIKEELEKGEIEDASYFDTIYRP